MRAITSTFLRYFSIFQLDYQDSTNEKLRYILNAQLYPKYKSQRTNGLVILSRACLR